MRWGKYSLRKVGRGRDKVIKVRVKEADEQTRSKPSTSPLSCRNSFKF